MLKIKDDVNLKELEKFGFEFSEDDNFYFYYEFTEPDCNSELRIYIDKDTREIRHYVYASDRTISTGFDMYVSPYKIHNKIYDLIKANLVEKV